jgi:hypothetical protein
MNHSSESQFVRSFDNKDVFEVANARFSSDIPKSKIGRDDSDKDERCAE